MNFESNIKYKFSIDESKILEIFKKYGVVSEKPIDLYNFVEEIDAQIYNRVYWSISDNVKTV